MALAGLPLGRIIRQGKTQSFVARNMLKGWCEEGFLALHNAGDEEEDDDETKGGGLKLKLSSGLRSLPLTLLAVIFIGTLGWLRWTATPPAGPHPGEALRQAQLHSEVVTAAQLFHYRKGEWPDNLNEMVRSGQLPPSILDTVEELGWKYTLSEKKNSFTFGS